MKAAARLHRMKRSCEIAFMTTTPLTIQCKAVEPFMKNGYVAVCAGTRHAAYVDPGDEAVEMLEWIDRSEIELVSILLTHAHLDHISGVGLVKQEWDVPIFLHQEDEFLYKALAEQAEWFGLQCDPAPPVDYHLHPAQQLSIGDLRVRVIHTPGHSPGSVSFVIHDDVFCGDVIFAGSIGRTDLPGGSSEILLKTIQSKILPLGPSVTLRPGHGPSTTVEKEKRENPFLQQLLPME